MCVAGADAVLADGNRGNSASGGCSVISVRLARSPQGQQVSSPLLLLPLLPLHLTLSPLLLPPSASSLWLRKWFHVFAVLVYLPGLALETDYLALAASLIIFLFTVLEVRAGHPHTDIEYTETLSVVYFIVHLQQLMRYFRMWPGGEGLHTSLLPLLDSQDSGPLLLSHLYLLLGFSLPLWVTPFRQYGHGELQCTLQTYIHWYTTSIS